MKTPRFEILAYPRNNCICADSFKTDDISTAFRVFDCFSVGGMTMAIYDRVQLIENRGDMRQGVEHWSHWVRENDGLTRLPRFDELLAEAHPHAHSF